MFQLIRDRPRTVDLEEFLSRPLFAHLATDSELGPRESPVLSVIRAVIGVVDFEREHGRVHHVGLRGRASVEPFDPERAHRLLRRYLGNRVDAWDPRFRETLQDPDNVLIRFDPETVVARDQSYEVEENNPPALGQ